MKQDQIADDRDNIQYIAEITVADYQPIQCIMYDF